MLKYRESSDYASASPVHCTDLTPQGATDLPFPVRMLTGRRFNYLIRRGAPRDRALIARDLEQGTLQIFGLTRAQAVALAKISSGYITTVNRLSNAERLQLARGELELSPLHKRRRDLSTDAQIDRLIARLGSERVMAALDRLTAPAGGNAATVAAE
jgi:hypothetical protein